MKPDHNASHQYKLTMILLLTISEELKVTKPMREAAGESRDPSHVRVAPWIPLSKRRHLIFGVHVLAPDGPLTYYRAYLGRLGLVRLNGCSERERRTKRRNGRKLPVGRKEASRPSSWMPTQSTVVA